MLVFGTTVEKTKLCASCDFAVSAAVVFYEWSKKHPEAL